MTNEIIQVTLIAIIMAISPGADFAMVTRNSLFYSRKAGLYSALGVACATWIHTAYTLAGLVVLIAAGGWLFTLVKWLGVAYLMYVGWKTWHSGMAISDNTGKAPTSGNWQHFRDGFITNATNPKTTLFYLSIFTQVVSPDTSLAMQCLYGLIICLAHGGWFALVALGITHTRVLSVLKRVGHHVGRVLGGSLMLMGISLANLNR